MKGLSELFGFSKNEASATSEVTTPEAGAAPATPAATAESVATATAEATTPEAGATTATPAATTESVATARIVTLSVAEYDTLKADAGMVTGLQGKVTVFEAKAKKWDAHQTALGNAGAGGDTTNNLSAKEQAVVTASEEEQKIRKYMNA